MRSTFGTQACAACTLGVCTLHIKLPHSPSRSGGDSPQEEAVPKRSDEKKAAEQATAHEQLESLLLADNPISSGKASKTNHRRQLATIVPQLRLLDGCFD